MDTDSFGAGLIIAGFAGIIFAFGAIVGSGTAESYSQCIADIKAFGGDAVVRKWDAEHRR